MKVLVTGSAGFLGSHIVDALLEAGHEIVGVDDLSGGDNFPVQTDRVRDRETHIVGSILNIPDMTYCCRGCDAVVHCAALAYEGFSVFSPSQVVENIVVGTTNVAVAAIRNGVKRFVNCSSMARYGNCDIPYRERMLPRPADPYGHAKLAAEGILNSLGAAHGMTVVHAVPHNIVGPRQKYDDPYRNVASIMVNRMLQGKPPVIYGDGEQTRCFSYVGDVVPIMVRMVTDDLDHGELFNVGPDGPGITINELFHELACLMEYNGVPIHVADRPMEVRLALCSSDKIRERFGFSAKVSLPDALRSVVEWIKAKGPKPFQYRLPIEIDGPNVPKTWKEQML